MENAKREKSVRIFSLASFFNDFGSDMISPVWPLFVTGILGANVLILGFIDGIGEATVSLSQAISGIISDKLRKRKIFVSLGYLFAATSRLGYALSPTWHYLVPFKILDRSGKMRDAPRDAMLADASKYENRGRNFGYLRALDNLGAVVGIITTLVLVQFLALRTIFFLAFIPSIVSLLLILIFIKERTNIQQIFTGYKFTVFNRDYLIFSALSVVFGLGTFSYSFLLLLAKQTGYQDKLLPVFYLLFTFIASVSSQPFGKLVDTIGRKKTLAIAYSLWAMTCIAALIQGGLMFIVLIFILYGLFRGAIEPSQRTFVAEIVPKEYRASGLGGFQMLLGLAAFPASLFAGLLWDKIGSPAPFVLALLLSLIALVMLTFVKDSTARLKQTVISD